MVAGSTCDQLNAGNVDRIVDCVLLMFHWAQMSSRSLPLSNCESLADMLASGREAYAWCHYCGLREKIDIEKLVGRVGEDYSLINRRSRCPRCDAWLRFHFRQASLYPMWDPQMSWRWDKIDREAQFGMCNKYEIYLNQMTQVFGRKIENVLRGINLPSDEINPGGHGVVWGADQKLHKMEWGFTTPKFSKRDPTKQIKPDVWNNARSENLHIPLWRESFVARRCLIPVIRFAEAEGPSGAMTRTWYSVPRGEFGDGDHFSIAGIWREEPAGNVYSMVMTSSASPVSRIHDRMPVIIAPADRESWLLGSPEQAKSLCVAWSGPLFEDRTAEKWYRPRAEDR